MGKITEVCERSFSSREEAENQLQAWKEFYCPLYGWMIINMWVSEEADGNFSAHLEAQK